jgi:hypothetical protein
MPDLADGFFTDREGKLAFEAFGAESDKTFLNSSAFRTA